MPNIELFDPELEDIRHSLRALEELIRSDNVELTRGHWNTLDQVERHLKSILLRASIVTRAKSTER